MAVSKAQQKAVAKYEAKKYDKTLIRLEKGRLNEIKAHAEGQGCLLYTSPSPRDPLLSRMPSSA